MGRKKFGVCACTYCGAVQKATCDEVFDKSLNKGARHIKQPSCNICNNEVYNSPQKMDLFAIFDLDIRNDRREHYKASDGDRKKFIDQCMTIKRYERGIIAVARLNHSLLLLTKKWFMGIRRECLGHEWSHIGHRHVVVFTIIDQPNGDLLFVAEDRRLEGQDDYSFLLSSLVEDEMRSFFVRHLRECGKFEYAFVMPSGRIDHPLAYIRYKPHRTDAQRLHLLAVYDI